MKTFSQDVFDCSTNKIDYWQTNPYQFNSKSNFAINVVEPITAPKDDIPEDADVINLEEMDELSDCDGAYSGTEILFKNW